MADPQSFAGQWLPNLTPEQQAAWAKQYAPMPAPPPAPVGARVISVPTQTFTPSDADAPPPPAMASALAAANGAPVAPQRPPAFPTGQQAPRAGDWKGREQFLAEQDAKQRASNLATATFAPPPGPPAPAGLVQVSKGGRTPASWTTQTAEGVKLSPETKQAAEKAEASEVSAAEAGRDAGVAEANRELSYLHTHEAYQARRQAMLEQRAEQQQSMYRASLAKLDSMTKAVQNDEIDPSLYWQKKGAAGFFMAALGNIVSGIGTGLMARAGMQAENGAMKAINQGIAEEIDAQKANAQLRRGKLEDQRSLLGQMAKTFGDERVAEEAAWMAYLEKAKTQLAEQMTLSKNDQVVARYKSAIAAIDGQIAGRREKWDQLEQDRITRVQHDVNAPAQYAGGAVKTDKHTDEQVTKLTEELEKAGIPQAYSQLQDIDRTIDTLGSGDIPGVGPIASKVPDVIAKQVYGDRAIAGRQAVANVKNATRKAIAGASLTENEKAELDKQLEGAHDADSLRRVVQTFRQTLSYRAKNIMSGANDNARAEYARRYKSIPNEAVPFNVDPRKGTAPYVRPPE